MSPAPRHFFNNATLFRRISVSSPPSAFSSPATGRQKLTDSPETRSNERPLFPPGIHACPPAGQAARHRRPNRCPVHSTSRRRRFSQHRRGSIRGRAPPQSKFRAITSISTSSAAPEPPNAPWLSPSTRRAVSRRRLPGRDPSGHRARPWQKPCRALHPRKDS